MGAPYTTTIQTVRDQICQWFGGSYDAASRSYRDPQVTNLGIVKRSRSKSENESDYFLGQPASGAVMGSMMYVSVVSGVETREAINGAHAGLKLLRSQVNLHCFLRSLSEFAEDAEDAFFQFLEDTKTRLRQDRSLGSGGWELGGFVAGEGGTGLRWQMRPPEVVSEMTTAELIFSFSVDYFEEG